MDRDGQKFKALVLARWVLQTVVKNIGLLLPTLTKVNGTNA